MATRSAAGRAGDPAHCPCARARARIRRDRRIWPRRELEVIRSRHLATTSSRGIGLSAVPRTAWTCSLSSVPSCEHDRDDRLPPWGAAIELLVGDELHLGALPQHRQGPACARHRARRRTTRSCRAASPRPCAADRCPECRGCSRPRPRGCRAARRPSRTSSAVEPASLHQQLQRIERRLDRRADRPFLDVGAHDLVSARRACR